MITWLRCHEAFDGLHPGGLGGAVCCIASPLPSKYCVVEQNERTWSKNRKFSTKNQTVVINPHYQRIAFQKEQQYTLYRNADIYRLSRRVLWIIVTQQISHTTYHSLSLPVIRCFHFIYNHKESGIIGYQSWTSRCVFVWRVKARLSK